MLKPTFGSFHQFTWFTNDMDRSLPNFKDVYGIPPFLVMDQSFDAVVGEQKDKMQPRIALAKVDDVEFEVIQPVGGGIDAIYRDALPADGSYATVFHHFCVRVGGALEDWERHLVGLHSERPIHPLPSRWRQSRRAICLHRRSRFPWTLCRACLVCARDAAGHDKSRPPFPHREHQQTGSLEFDIGGVWSIPCRNMLRGVGMPKPQRRRMQCAY